MVQVDDLIVLGIGETVARIRTQVVRIKTSPPKEIPEPNHREEILERSHRLHYRPAHQVKRMLARPGRRWEEPFTPRPRRPLAQVKGRSSSMTDSIDLPLGSGILPDLLAALDPDRLTGQVMRSRASPGGRCTNPESSWELSRNPGRWVRPRASIAVSAEPPAGFAVTPTIT